MFDRSRERAREGDGTSESVCWLTAEGGGSTAMPAGTGAGAATPVLPWTLLAQAEKRTGARAAAGWADSGRRLSVPSPTLARTGGCGTSGAAGCSDRHRRAAAAAAATAAAAAAAAMDTSEEYVTVSGPGDDDEAVDFSGARPPWFAGALAESGAVGMGLADVLHAGYHRHMGTLAQHACTTHGA
eukprot:357485-Chlamydomonas_euryale.AAC.5